jgi:hypothetical protein
MKSKKKTKKQKRRGGGSNLDSCEDTHYRCYGYKDGDTKYCEQWKPGSVCYSSKCYTPANCRNPTIPDIKASETKASETNASETNASETKASETNAIDPKAPDPLKTIDPLKATDPNAIDSKNGTDGKSGSNNLINGVVGVAGLGAMYMGYKWLNKKKASSHDSSSPEKRKSSHRKRKSSRRKRKSSHRKSISHR